MIPEVLISLIVALLLWSAYFHLWRNELVYRYRMNKLINEGADAYGELPTYSYMVYHPIEWSDLRLIRKCK